ncbi:MAG TPA: hypothetical protein VMZ91_03085 [Candidatus Paceibacterota bacterium]|nr:hypothetical protein [Candidatus Paceibacterota bacterium]
MKTIKKIRKEIIKEINEIKKILFLERKRKYEKEYRKRPKTIANKKKYYARPEIKAKYKEYQKKYQKEYYARPEIKAKYREIWKRRKKLGRKNGRTKTKNN